MIPKELSQIVVSVVLVLGLSGIAFGQSEELMTIKVFFVDTVDNENIDDCGKVRAIERRIPKTLGAAKAALNELFKGPTEQERKKGLSSLFSEKSAGILRSIKVKDGAAYVNFKDWVIPNFGVATTSCGSSAFFAEVENTLKQFPTIKKIFYAIEKDPMEFYEWMQIGECPKELLDCEKKCSGEDF